MTSNVEQVSDFNDVVNADLRGYNRGQVLTNIFQAYEVGGNIPAGTFKHYLHETNEYLIRIPDVERAQAKLEHAREMARRGFTNDKS